MLTALQMRCSKRGFPDALEIRFNSLQAHASTSSIPKTFTEQNEFYQVRCPHSVGSRNESIVILLNELSKINCDLRMPCEFPFDSTKLQRPGEVSRSRDLVASDLSLVLM